MFTRRVFIQLSAVFLILLSWLIAPLSHTLAQAADPNPPSDTVRLIFIHHSTGENWLTDGYGNLGLTLGENNYFVSDTNYGWGPEAIGDRTDILNWPEWFRSENTPIYMEALYNENGQNSAYTRLLTDPGGENMIILFKSCFPNSMLEGNPDDPALPADYLTVGAAKSIYNDLLNYFITRPDKLFIVITAPPVQDPTYAENARAFNNWLVDDWLSENRYPFDNVAVFDFYTILTHPENHHRYNPGSGEIEHITTYGDNTLFYPSGDDHPSEAGSQKATEEFLPWLNVIYHSWLNRAPDEAPTPVQEPTGRSDSTASPVVTAMPSLPDLIDNFDAGHPVNTDGWQANWDSSTLTEVSCAPEEGPAISGTRALHTVYELPPGNWATCTLFYQQALDWQDYLGIAFYLRSSQPGLLVDVTMYGGTLQESTTYQFTLETTPDMVGEFAAVTLTWEQFLRVAWEADPGQPFPPNNVMGFGFGFSSDTEPVSGELWVDDIVLYEGSEPPPIVDPEAITDNQNELIPTLTAIPAVSGPDTGPGINCPGSLAVGFFGLLALGFSDRRKRR